MKILYGPPPLFILGDYVLVAQEIIDALYEIPRTGWVDRGVKNPETVGGHTDELLLLAKTFFSIPGLEIILVVHDWPETDKKVGDRRTDIYCPIEHRWTKEEKYEVELKAMQKIALRLGPYGDEVLALWLEYEKKETERAQIAYQLDKLQAILKAIEYQRIGQPVIAQEFIDHDGDKIQHPVLIKLLSEFKKGVV